MTLFKLRAENRDYDLNVVSNMPFGGEQNVIVYEAVGSDGGVVLTTGRSNKKITFEGKLISKANNMDDVRADLNTTIEDLSNLRDRAIPVKVISPIVQNDTGIYIIKTFYATLTEGQGRAIPFTMELDEYRQRGVKKALVNLVNFQPAELLKQRARDRNILTGG